LSTLLVYEKCAYIFKIPFQLWSYEERKQFQLKEPIHLRADLVKGRSPVSSHRKVRKVRPTQPIRLEVSLY
jgi:hypothetical protein